MKKLLISMCIALLASSAAVGFTACSKDGNSSSSSSVEEVKDAPVISNKPTDNTLTITAESNTYQFEIAEYDGKITWISTVASVATISESGLLTLHKAGHTEVIAKDESTGLSDSVVLTITDERAAETLTITGIPETVRVGDAAIQLGAISSQDGEVSATYTSSNPSVATVSETGLFTPVGSGITTITATKVGTDIKVSVEVEVLGAAITSISIVDLPKYGMLVGNTYPLYATCAPENCENYEVEWSVDNTDVAVLDSLGNLIAISQGQCTVTATVKGTDIKTEQVLTISELSTDREDFRFASVGTSNVFNVGPIITLSNVDGEIVEYGEDQALKIKTRGNGTYNYFAIDFGKKPAGQYKITMRFDIESGTHGGAIAKEGAADKFTTIGQSTNLGDNLYSFILNHEGGNAKLRFVDPDFNATGSVIIDDVSIKELVFDPDALKVMPEGVLNFDGVADGANAAEYGIYAKNGIVTVENGAASLNVSRIEQLVLSLGNVSKGIYKLKFDATLTGGYPAILQIVDGMTVDTEGMVEWASCTTLYNEAGKKLDEFVTADGNTYELTLNLDKDYQNLGIVFINNNAELTCGMTLDNISFAALDYTEKQTLQKFDHGMLASDSWSKKPGLKNAASAHVDFGGTYSGSIEDGAYKTTINSATTYSRVNLGWFEAGTYTFTFDAKASGSDLKGQIILSTCTEHSTSPDTALDGAVHNKAKTTFTEEWATYSYTITLDEGKFIKFGVDGRDTTFNAMVWLDNFTVQAGEVIVTPPDDGGEEGGDDPVTPPDDGGDDPVVEPTVYELNTIDATPATFDDAEKAAWQYGVYAKGAVVGIENGAATLNVTGVEQLVLSLGNVNKGIYKLTFDATMTSGYPAILQVVTGLSVDSETGLASWEGLETLYNAAGKTLNEFVTPNGTTYELTLRFDNDYTNVGLILINNQAELTCGISLDNISFAVLDYTEKQVVQGFDSALLGKASWSAKPGLINVANAHVDYSGTFDGMIENGVYKVTINADMKYSRVNLGWFEAGTYTFTFDAKASGANLNGAWTLTTCSDHPTSPDTAMDGANHNKNLATFTEDWTTYSYTITLTEGAFIKMGVIRGIDTSTLDAVVYMDNFTAQAGEVIVTPPDDGGEDDGDDPVTPPDDGGDDPVVEPTVYELNTIGATPATFDDADKAAWQYGVYAANTVVGIENGAASLNVTGVEQLVLSLGNVNKGIYKLKFDATMTGGYPAILQMVTGLSVDSETGLASWEALETLYNAAGKQLNEFATPNGTTYELTLRFDNDYTNVGLILINNQEIECGIALDNISFAALDYTEKQVVQNFDSALLGKATWSSKPGLINVANAHVDYGGTFSGSIEDGAYKTTINSATTYSRVNLGWFEAGTYTFTFKAKASGSDLNGQIILSTCVDHATSSDTAMDGAVHNKTAATFTEEWVTYSYTITLEEGKFVKFGVDGRNTAFNATVWLDDFTVQKTA